MRPSFDGLVRSFGALQGTGRRRCESARSRDPHRPHEFRNLARRSAAEPLADSQPGRLKPPGTRNQTDVDVVQVMVELMGSGQFTVGMKADVYFRFGQLSDR